MKGKRVSIYLKDDWFFQLLTRRVEAGKMFGRDTSIGREILEAAKQQMLREMHEERNANPPRT